LASRVKAGGGRVLKGFGAEVRIGTKIRHTRLLNALTLKRVAEAAGCSESVLSKIENGRASPSLRMVHRIAAALDVTVGRLFAQEDDGEHIVARAGTRPMIETDQVHKGKGLRLEPLIANVAGHLLECHINHIEPGARSDGDLQHDGEEFGYMLEGSIELTVGGRRYLIETGDGFCFRSERPHSWRNRSKIPAKILWINTPPSF
jgi:quercetin dioxygenase-like cupin family protein/DNA-binding XRE family transcriptional regulator